MAVTRYQKLKAAGLCQCGQPREGTRSRCRPCLDRESARTRDNPRDPKYIHEWQATRKSAGLCRNCETPRRPGKLDCEPCATRRREYAVSRIRERKAAGLCAACGEPAHPNYYCRKCAHRKRGVHGISRVEASRMLAEQHGACKLCGVFCDRNTSSEKPVVDHSHETGRVRGVICQRCNIHIGGFEAIAKRGLLPQLLAYLKEPEAE